MIPKIFSSIFSVCSKTFMISLRDYKCTENEKTEIISHFIYLGERGLIFAVTFLLRNVTSTFIEPLRTRISRRQLVPRRQNWEN